MHMPSLSQVRSVVDLFLSRISSFQSLWAEEVKKPPKPKEELTGPELARREQQQAVSKKTVFEDPRYTFRGPVEKLIYGWQEFDPASKVSGVWDSPDLDMYVKQIPEKLFDWTRRLMYQKLTTLLNRSVGVYDYYLYLPDPKEPVTKRPEKYIESFSGPLMMKDHAYNLFATKLKRTKKEKDPAGAEQSVPLTGKDLAGMYKIWSEPRPVVDLSEVRAMRTKPAEPVVEDMVTEMISKYVEDPDSFVTLIAKKTIGKEPDVTWLRPLPTTEALVEKKTEEDVAIPGEGSLREMDKVAKDYLEESMLLDQPVPFEYSRVRGPEGAAESMLDLVLTEKGREVSVVVPPRVGGALRDAREGETFSFKVLDFDRNKGFKVRFRELGQKMLSSEMDKVRKGSFSVDDLSYALRRALSDYVGEQIVETATDKAPEIIEQYLGEPIYKGKNLSTDEGLRGFTDEARKELEEELKLTEAPAPDKKEEDKKDRVDAWTVYRERMDELEEMRERQEEVLPKQVVEVMHGKQDPWIRRIDTIAHTLASKAPPKANFAAKDARTWTVGNAFNTKDGIRWLATTMMRTFVEGLEEGGVDWSRMMESMLNKGILADIEETRRYLGSDAIENVMQALKMATIAKEKGVMKDERQRMLREYLNGTLQVTPEERRRIVFKMLNMSSEDRYAIRKRVSQFKENIQKAFWDLYKSGDPLIEGIVTRAQSMRLRRGLEGLRDEERRMVAADKKTLEDLTRQLLSGRLDDAKKTMVSFGVPKDKTGAVGALASMQYVNPGDPDRSKAERMIKNIQEMFAEHLKERTGEIMLKRLKSVGGTKEDTEEAKEKAPVKKAPTPVIQPVKTKTVVQAPPPALLAKE